MNLWYTSRYYQALLKVGDIMTATSPFWLLYILLWGCTTVPPTQTGYVWFNDQYHTIQCKPMDRCGDSHDPPTLTCEVIK